MQYGAVLKLLQPAKTAPKQRNQWLELGPYTQTIPQEAKASPSYKSTRMG